MQKAQIIQTQINILKDNKLNYLIHSLYPQGIAHKPLQEILAYEQPTKYLVKNTQYSNSYKTPVLTAGQTFILGYTNETDNIYQASKQSPVIIFDDFTTSHKWVDFPFKIKSSAIKILTCRNTTCNIRFVFYCMQSIQYNHTEHSRQWITKYSLLKIPLPPLEIQNEIVRILDNFTITKDSLIKELEKEFLFRKKQYSYYRDLLLDFKDIEKKDHYSNSFYSPCHSKHSKESHKQIIDSHSKALAKESHIFKIDSQNKNPKKESEIIESKTHNQDSKIPNILTESKHTIKAILERKSYPKKLKDLLLRLCPYGVEYKKISDIAQYRRGSFPQPYTNPQWYGGENAKPFIQVADIDKNMQLMQHTKQTISQIAQQQSVFVPHGTVIVALQGATLGKVAITQYDAYIDRTIAIFETYKVTINKKFFAHVLYQKFAIEKKSARGGTIKTITKEEFSNFKIPIPPLEIQNEIVRILDKFETLINDLTTGIPAEIELRKKQYEYYRNRLLSFRELEKKEV